MSRKSKLQNRVALSTMEVEYIAISEATKEIIWLKNFLNELRKEQDNVGSSGLGIIKKGGGLELIINVP